MSPQKRLLLASLLLLSLFALNLGIHEWSSRRREAGFEALRQAIARQALIAAVRQQIGDLQKEMALLTDVYAESASAGVSIDELARFKARIDILDATLRDLEGRAPGEGEAGVKRLTAACRDLAWSWSRAFVNLGVDTARSIKELSLRADPLGLRVMRELMPELERQEERRSEAARDGFYRVARLTERVTVGIFVLSAAIGVFVVWTVSRQLVSLNRALEARVDERTRELADSLSRLRESEDRYALAARGANDGLWDWDLKARRIYLSPRWKSMLGLVEARLSEQPLEWFSRVHREDRERLGMEIVAHLEGLTTHFQHEYRMRHADGSWRWVLSRGLAVRAEDGEAVRIAGSLTDVTQRKSVEEQLLHDAFHDALTGLPNRALFIDRLALTMAKARARISRRREHLFAVLFLDVDRFKVVNDGLGHAIGDELLVAVARRLESCLRPGDTVARMGGDEFTILLDDITDLEQARQIADRIQDVVTQPLSLAGQELFTSVSIGIVSGGSDYQRPEELLRDADTAMYRAKSLGKARHEVFDAAMRARVVSVLQLETKLRQALDREEFRIVYQPIVSLASGAVTGFEALLRWQHPERGLVSSQEFISVAEDTGLIVPLGAWVVRQACLQLRAWDSVVADRPPLCLSVNLSGRQFRQRDLADQIAQALGDAGIEPWRLRLEITESVIMENTETARETLARLRELQVQLHMDDFGTGYSSMSYLRQFQIDALKIDRSFVSHMGPRGEQSEIVRTIVNLGHSLGLEVIAEGIETSEQLALLRSLGCQSGQGFYFSRPVDGDTAPSLFAGTPLWQA